MANSPRVEMSLQQKRNGSQENLPDTPPPEYDSISGAEVKSPICAVDVANLLGEPPEYAPLTEKQKSSGEFEREDDPWAMPELKDTGVKWSDLDCCGKAKRVVLEWFGKAICLITLLYLFICSLDFLSSAFRLLGGKAAGEAFTNNELIQNPVAGLMLGIIATILVQSSSTSTSIVVTMVASGILEVRPAIPIIMGANIGTSVTSTLVSLAHSGDKDEFRRAFGGATVHDMFNWLTVLFLLPIEALTGYLYHLSDLIVSSYNLQSADTNKDLLKVITKPFTKLLIQLDKKVIEGIATGDKDVMNKSLIKHWCKYKEELVPTNLTFEQNITVVGLNENVTSLVNVTKMMNMTKKVGTEECHFLFSYAAHLGDSAVGIILLAISLLLLCTCLVLMVKLLHSMLQGRIAITIKKTVNADFPGKLSFLTGYIAIIVGAGMTILVQSSSIFTSALTPLVGIGVISLDRMYPLTLGSNIGTTATGLLAALASSSDRLQFAIQIGLCHLMFNISGIILFYPIPHLRKLPIRLAMMLGDTTAEYRWFPVFYLLIMFIVIPGAIFGLSVAGLIPLLCVLIPLAIAVLFVVIINVLQRKKPTILPAKMRNWELLPEWLHSLAPLDRQISKLVSCFRRVFPCCCRAKKPLTPSESISSDSSIGYISNESGRSFGSTDSSATLLRVTSL